MKIIGRILVFLAAALIVVGATIAISSLGPAGQTLNKPGEFGPGSLGAFSEEYASALQPSHSGSAVRQFVEGESAGIRPGRGHEREGGGAFILFSMARNLIVVVMIILIYIVFDLLLARLNSRRAWARLFSHTGRR